MAGNKNTYLERRQAANQAMLDAALREIWEKDLCTFYERYPQLKKIDYTKSKKNWRE